MNNDKRHIGFWSLQTINPEFWTFEPIYIQGNPKFNSIPPRSRWHYGEMAVFYISGYGELYSEPQSSLIRLDGYKSVILWLECWEYGCIYEDPINNPTNHKYRLRYNDGDDGYMEKFYEFKQTALDDFELLKMVTYQSELDALFISLNFNNW